MDDLVLQAMAKWPHVPACTGWLGLDDRGDWYMRDDAAQRAGPFAGQGASLASKGSRLQHAALMAFIGRNYLADAMGQWYFQNGPQRVYVELCHAPWVIRLDPEQGFLTHTGQCVVPQETLMDELGHVYVVTALGLGLVHGQDMLAMAAWLEQRGVVPKNVVLAALPTRYGFCLSPAQTKEKPT